VLRHALTVGFANKLARRMRMHNGYNTVNGGGQLAQLHPGSAHLRADEDGLLPEWVIYHELVATSRPYLRQVGGWGGGLGPGGTRPGLEGSQPAVADREQPGCRHLSGRRCAAGPLARSETAPPASTPAHPSPPPPAGAPCQVCPVEYRWVEPLLPKLTGVNVRRLSKGRLLAEKEAEAAAAAAARGGGAGGGGAGGGSGSGGGGAAAAGAAAAAAAAAAAVKRNDGQAVDAARQRYLQRKAAAAAAAPAKKR
jgi:hypothetical protein